MKKTFGLYFIGWLAALGLFNVITFVTPNEINGIGKFDTLFWVAYAFITLSFIGQLICAFVFRADSLQKAFYNISLFRISIFALIAICVIGGVCMAVVQIPDWIGIILCSIVLTINIIAVVKAMIAIGAVSEVDKKIKAKTLFIKTLTVEAQTLMAKTEDEQLLGMAKKVFEAIRYSDPMSNSALCAVEDRISDTFNEFSAAIEKNSIEAAQTSSKTLLSLIGERNAKCKSLK